MKMVIERFKTQPTATQTLGIMFVLEGSDMLFKCFTLELPDRQNVNNISNIPTGIYSVVKRRSSKHGAHFHILDVPGRNLILIHKGNYAEQTEGCILVGSDLKDINGDRALDVSASAPTMAGLNKILPGKFNLKIL